VLGSASPSRSTSPPRVSPTKPSAPPKAGPPTKGLKATGLKPPGGLMGKAQDQPNFSARAEQLEVKKTRIDTELRQLKATSKAAHKAEVGAAAKGKAAEEAGAKKKQFEDVAQPSTLPGRVQAPVLKESPLKSSSSQRNSKRRASLGSPIKVPRLPLDKVLPEEETRAAGGSQTSRDESQISSSDLQAHMKLEREAQAAKEQKKQELEDKMIQELKQMKEQMKTELDKELPQPSALPPPQVKRKPGQKLKEPSLADARNPKVGAPQTKNSAPLRPPSGDSPAPSLSPRLVPSSIMIKGQAKEIYEAAARLPMAAPGGLLRCEVLLDHWSELSASTRGSVKFEGLLDVLRGSDGTKAVSDKFITVEQDVYSQKRLMISKKNFQALYVETVKPA